jgi:hypothetical protein
VIIARTKFFPLQRAHLEHAEHMDDLAPANRGLFLAVTTSAGGEDCEDVIQPEERDRRIGQKSSLHSEKLAALWPPGRPGKGIPLGRQFDTSLDGLPLIGPVNGAKSVLLRMAMTAMAPSDSLPPSCLAI